MAQRLELLNQIEKGKDTMRSLLVNKPKLFTNTIIVLVATISLLK